MASAVKFRRKGRSAWKYPQHRLRVLFGRHPSGFLTAIPIYFKGGTGRLFRTLAEAYADENN